MQTQEEKESVMHTIYRRMMHAIEHEYRERTIAERKERENLDHGYFDIEERKIFRRLDILGIVLTVLVMLFVFFY